jgi:hypothetical protein
MTTRTDDLPARDNPHAFASIVLPEGIRPYRDGLGWESSTHSLGLRWQEMGEDGESGWSWWMHSASDHDSGGLDSLDELHKLFARMTE